jgi:hypothetical protein
LRLTKLAERHLKQSTDAWAARLIAAIAGEAPDHVLHQAMTAFPPIVEKALRSALEDMAKFRLIFLDQDGNARDGEAADAIDRVRRCACELADKPPGSEE